MKRYSLFWCSLFVALAALPLSFVALAQTTIVASDDAFIVNGTPDLNSGGDSGGSGLRVRGSSPTGTTVRMTYIKFNLSSYVGTIARAEVRFWVDMAVNDKFASAGAMDRVDFFKVTDDWQEMTITWNNAPPRGQHLFSVDTIARRTNTNPPMPDTLYSWNVTSYVQEQYAGDKIVSLVLADTTYNGTDLRMYSSESAGFEPVLVISQGTTDVPNEPGIMPERFALSQNYPNPFNPETKIAYAIPTSGYVEAAVYTVLGERVRTLRAGTDQAGFHQLSWDGRANDGRPMASGVYFCRVQFGGLSQTVKMLLTR